MRTTSLAAGSRLGPYEILALVGAGGMGEVYRAKDTRLDRTVAIKVLPAHLAIDQELQQRFEREARVVSSLNHPNICTLYDIGRQNGTQYLVMEYLEGLTLNTRLQKGPLPWTELLQYSIQMADALDKAHRKGIVHRDLKPGNVTITKSGVKLLDFGLARIPIQSKAASNASSYETERHDLTEEGTILGTLQYMAPEQLEGKSTDARSDIFSFGAVLYEMATGRRAFEASSGAGLIAAILKEEPKPITESLPPGLERLIHGCLAKDPDERRQNAHDITAELKWIAENQNASTAVLPRVRTGRRKFPVAAAIMTLFAIIAFLAGILFRQPIHAPVSRMNILLPSGFSLDPLNTSLSLSPDGRMLAFTGTDEDGKTGLWLRRLNQTNAHWIPGTQDASYPFWSPDSRYVAFFSNRKLMKVPASGAPVQTLCDAPDSRGGTWSKKDLIVFSPSSSGGLSAIPSSGGSAIALTDTQGKYISHRLPHFLPDSQHVLFFLGELGIQHSKNDGVYCLDIISKKITRVLSLETEAFYMDPGFLIFVREGSLMAQPFDAKKLDFTGEAKAIAEGIHFYGERYTGAYTIAGSLLIYQSETMAPMAQLTWFDLDGRRLGLAGRPAEFASIKLAPDGKHAFTTFTTSHQRDLWVRDLASSNNTRITFHKDAYLEGGAVWSPDGTKILYGNSDGKLFIVPSDSTSLAQSIAPQSWRWWPRDWSLDSATVVMETHRKETGSDLGVFSFKDQSVSPFVASKANETLGGFSPDGKWFGYMSDESGRFELYVVPYPGPGGKWQISTDGVTQWKWTRDGILYLTPDRRLIATEVNTSSNAFQVAARRALFGGTVLPQGLVEFAFDGTRLLIALPTNEARADTLNVIQNWTTQLQ